MKRNLISFLLVWVFTLSAAFGQTNINPTNFAKTKNGALKAWIFLKDKGNEQVLLAKPEALLSPRAIQRRQLRVPNHPLIDFSDLPVAHEYVRKIKNQVQRIRVVSKWLNAVSVEASAQALDRIAQWPFVLRIDPIAVGRPLPPPEIRDLPRFLPKSQTRGDSLPYGLSLKQVNLINVPYLHSKGLYGTGVIILMLDDGVNLLYKHEALKKVKILATHDFIHGDNAIDDSGIKAYEGWHGTMTLSVIAGYTPETLIGPAFDASFILAKTEVDQFERPIEEDYWVAGLEWGDSLGADIVSSSLGYIDWYTPADMNGETAKTTIAADKAVEKGILVFNSAGNEGENAEHNTLIAPADGKKVLAVAAVDRNGVRASFSSVGPSADGRIKPDIAAMGVSVVIANSKDSTGFSYGSGTSFSCPLAAGGAALLLEAFPSASPELMTEALKNTASQAKAPDNLLGWGIIDLKKAYAYLDSAVVRIDTTAGHLVVSHSAPNPANEYTQFSYAVKYPSVAEINIYNALGQKVTSLGKHIRQANNLIKERLETRRLASGVYFARIVIRELESGHVFRKTLRFTVLH